MDCFGAFSVSGGHVVTNISYALDRFLAYLAVRGLSSSFLKFVPVQRPLVSHRPLPPSKACFCSQKPGSMQFIPSPTLTFFSALEFAFGEGTTLFALSRRWAAAVPPCVKTLVCPSVSRSVGRRWHRRLSDFFSSPKCCSSSCAPLVSEATTRIRSAICSLSPIRDPARSATLPVSFHPWARVCSQLQTRFRCRSSLPALQNWVSPPLASCNSFCCIGPVCGSSNFSGGSQQPIESLASLHGAAL